jgi:hypothetical protein
MLNNRSLRFRLLATGIALTSIPLMVVSALVWWLDTQIERASEDKCRTLVVSDLDHVAQGIYNSCYALNAAENIAAQERFLPPLANRERSPRLLVRKS